MLRDLRKALPKIETSQVHMDDAILHGKPFGNSYNNHSETTVNFMKTLTLFKSYLNG
jgi:hypothetical protein